MILKMFQNDSFIIIVSVIFVFSYSLRSLSQNNLWIFSKHFFFLILASKFPRNRKLTFQIDVWSFVYCSDMRWHFPIDQPVDFLITSFNLLSFFHSIHWHPFEIFVLFLNFLLCVKRTWKIHQIFYLKMNINEKEKIFFLLIVDRMNEERNQFSISKFIFRLLNFSLHDTIELQWMPLKRKHENFH